MDLREKIAEILYQRPEYPSGMAEKLARDAAQRRADAVMGIVEARVRELEDENQRMRDDLAQAVKMRDVNNRLLQCAADRANRAEAQARAARGTVADLEQQRDSIAARIVEEERGMQRKILKDPTNPSLAGLLVGLQRSRGIVTSRAREIAEEKA